VLDVVPWLREERASLLSLLADLEPAAWELPTECPGWTVHGIALHILGDDLSLLSRQRDAAPSGLIAVAQRGEARDFRGLLNAFNEAWVTAAAFLSPPLVCHLLQISGEWTADWYEQVPGDRLGEPVVWLGPEPAPYWLIAAREYVERWVHHQQIARATGAPTPSDTTTRRVVETLAFGFPRLLGPVHAPDDAVVAITVLDRTWTLNGPGGGWVMSAGRPESPTAEVALPSPDLAARAFSRGLTAAEMTEAVQTSGNAEVAAAVTQMLVEGFSISY
jgi:uncharacterized protein (TIGR03083 family)